MDNNMKAVFELGRAAMLAVEGGKIIHANSRAEEIFGRSLIGASPVGIIPDHILANDSPNFVSSAIIGDKAYCAQAARLQGRLYVSFEPERSHSHSSVVLSDALLSSMLSTIFNIGMVIDRVSAETANSGSEKLESYLAILNHNYFRIRHSLSNLSTAINLKNGSLPFFFRAVDLACICSEIVSTVSVLCGNKGITIDFSTQHGELFAWADGEKIERILLNLISNSLWHTPAGGRISVGLEKSGDTAYISVDDTGCGIPAADMAELFTAYDRELDLTKLSESGGGFGLCVARGLAEAHEGAIIIESREGKGTSVRVMLPLRSASLSVLESPPENYTNAGMSLILTELATVLGSESYTSKYLD